MEGEARVAAAATPFIKKFRTEGHRYIYDCNTSRILLVTDAMYDIVDTYWQRSRDDVIGSLRDRHRAEDLEQGYALVAALAEEHRLLSTSRPRSRVGVPTHEELEEALRQSTPSLTLEVTEECNMRCRYCAFSGGYPLHRTHSARHMDASVARAAVELYHGLERPDGDSYSISFYGGEPLLRFGLLRDVVSLAKALPRMSRAGVRFSLTTNATLLNEEMIRFFAAENFSLLISLDGDRRNHDRNRVLANGSGSFGRVLAAVHEVRRLTSAEYYRTNVNFNCVLSPASNLLELDSFFGGNPELFEGKRIHVSSVSPGNEEFLSGCGVCESTSDDNTKLKAMYDDAYAKNTTHSLCFIAGLYEQSVVTVHKRHLLDGPREHIGISPTCLAAGRRLFVACDGSLHVCERINTRFPIGDVYSGIDLHRLHKMVEGFAALMNAPDCLDCWAMHFCPHCYATLAADGEFSQSQKDATCETRRGQVLRHLVHYCSVLERNPEAWKPLDKVVVK